MPSADLSLPTSPGGVRIDRVVTSGQFCLDGGCWDVDNNVWIIGNDEECLVVDCAHEADKIVAGIGGRRVVALVCTHGHNDHVNASDEVKAATGGQTWLNPACRVLWDQSQTSEPDHELSVGQVFSVGDVEITALHTPGHAPGATCLSIPSLGVLLSGDTLFNGGPGATGRSYSDFPTIIDSIRDRLLTLPEETIVLTGHGNATSIGAEKPHLEEWIARGH